MDRTITIFAWEDGDVTHKDGDVVWKDWLITLDDPALSLEATLPHANASAELPVFAGDSDRPSTSISAILPAKQAVATRPNAKGSVKIV
jgi:hypothetical protein